MSQFVDALVIFSMLIMITPGSKHDRGSFPTTKFDETFRLEHTLNTSFIFGGFTISSKFTPLKSNIDTTKMMVWKTYRLSTIAMFGIYVEFWGAHDSPP